jgi:hypothetical protein
MLLIQSILLKYRDQAVTQLKDTRAESVDDKKRVLDILKRFHQQIEEDDVTTRQNGSSECNFYADQRPGDAEYEDREDSDAGDIHEEEAADVSLDSILSKETLGRILMKVNLQSPVFFECVISEPFSCSCSAVK